MDSADNAPYAEKGNDDNAEKACNDEGLSGGKNFRWNNVGKIQNSPDNFHGAQDKDGV